MFGTDIYVRVTRNLFRVKNLKSGQEAQGVPEAPFSTTRLLVGNFESAQSTLKAALAQVGSGSFLVSPNVLMHPLEMVEGGLSQIEERIFQELAVGAGAKKVIVFVGPALADAEVSAKLKGKQTER
jgi:rod shape-determining protein MreB and related proteins